MKSKPVVKEFTIEASSPQLMEKFERLLALLHFASSFGHTGTFAMALDGDGREKIKVTPKPGEFVKQVDLVSGIGGQVEIAINDGFTAKKMTSLNHEWYVEERDGKACLIRDGKVVKTLE